MLREFFSIVAIVAVFVVVASCVNVVGVGCGQVVRWHNVLLNVGVYVCLCFFLWRVCMLRFGLLVMMLRNDKYHGEPEGVAPALTQDSCLPMLQAPLEWSSVITLACQLPAD